MKQDLTGQIFGELTVVKYHGKNSDGKKVWECRCSCGNLVLKNASFLKIGKEFYCGPNHPTKVCVLCKIDKPKSEYHKRLTKPCGVQSKCISCMSEYKKKRYWNNHEVELKKHTKSRTKPENLKQRKGYYEQNKEDYHRRYKAIISNPDKKMARKKKSKEHRLKFYEKISSQKKEYRSRPEVKERIRAEHKRRLKEDVVYLLKRRLRFRLRGIVKRLGNSKYKSASAIKLVGCDMGTFKKHIESQFVDGMCWERLGEIHLDHIKPCARFDLTDAEEQKKCFHFTNIQPLWALDNLRKHAKYGGDYPRR